MERGLTGTHGTAMDLVPFKARDRNRFASESRFPSMTALAEVIKAHPTGITSPARTRMRSSISMSSTGDVFNGIGRNADARSLAARSTNCLILRSARATAKILKHGAAGVHYGDHDPSECLTQDQAAIIDKKAIASMPMLLRKDPGQSRPRGPRQRAPWRHPESNAPEGCRLLCKLRGRQQGRATQW